MAQAAFAFELPGDGYRREDFLVSDANREALAWIGRWPGWPAQGLMLSGPEASGKTHLAHLWAEAAGARFIPPEAVGKEEPEALLERVANPIPAPPYEGRGRVPAAVVDGLENIASEEGLFHLLNHAKHAGGWLLLTSRLPVARLDFHLPDLRSRLNALPAARMEAPDDALLAAVIAKQFSDRQLKVGEEVIAWLLPRIERSFAGAKRAVETIDRAALQRGRTVTIPFIREIFPELKDFK